MANVSMVYYSVDSETGFLSEAVFKGISCVPGVIPYAHEIGSGQLRRGYSWRDDSVISVLNDSDAIIFGSDSFSGGVSSTFRSFMEAVYYQIGGYRWKDKLAGGFTGYDFSGCGTFSLLELVIFACRMGMIWISAAEFIKTDNDFNSIDNSSKYFNCIGPVCDRVDKTEVNGKPELSDLLVCERYGRRVALLARSRELKGSADSSAACDIVTDFLHGENKT